MGSKNYMQNREFSWLRFNERVMEEACAENGPLLERLKFLAIFTSNLDEFFMIRVGSLYDLSLTKDYKKDKRSGLSALDQIKEIHKRVRPQYEVREKLFKEIEASLRKQDIYNLDYEELSTEEAVYVEQYYNNNIYPVLSPQVINANHPFPNLRNKELNVCAWLKSKDKNHLGIVSMPNTVPRLIFLPDSENRYITAEKVIMHFLPKIFNMYTTKETVVACVTRNADINQEENPYDTDIDFRNQMKKLLKKRARLQIVRLELSNYISKEFTNYLCKKMDIEEDYIFISNIPIDLSYVFALYGRVESQGKIGLIFKKFKPQNPQDVINGESLIAQVQRKDVLLSFPYEKIDPYLRLIKEAATDENVLSIKITIYRLASKAKIVQYLCEAAENGKEVIVLIELRARFDEQNNIDWSETLEEAGCKIIYGFEGFKVHSKITLITLKDKNEIRYITQVGTGNYNEKTAELYTDLSLITANQKIGMDTAKFFNNLSISKIYGEYDHLMVAPSNLRATIFKHIDHEIQLGKNGRITIKINSITDVEMIDKLREASRAGVQIKMIIRGICCILPGVKDETENIHIISIVGRFLEHSRIYCFGNGINEKMYIASADFMTRNLRRRVEVACPIYDATVKSEINSILDILFRDNVKGRILKNDGTYEKIIQDLEIVDSQSYLMNRAIERANNVQVEPKAEPKKGFFGFLARLFSKKNK